MHWNACQIRFAMLVLQIQLRLLLLKPTEVDLHLIDLLNLYKSHLFMKNECVASVHYRLAIWLVVVLEFV